MSRLYVAGGIITLMQAVRSLNTGLRGGVIAALALLLCSCPAGPDPARAQTVEFLVTRMTCTDCDMAISAELERIDGVFEASADFTRGYASARYDPEITSPEELIAEVEKLGYGVRVRQPGDADIPPVVDSPPGAGDEPESAGAG